MRRSLNVPRHQALIAALMALAVALAGIALLPTGSASALPPPDRMAKPTEEPDPTDPPVDITPPTITAPMPAGGWNGWYSGTTILDVSATDTQSGVSAFTYSLSGASSGSGNLTPAGATVTISNSGQTKVRLEAEDVWGNQTAVERTIGIDREMPSITVEVPTNEQTFKLGQVVSAVLGCADANTAIKECKATPAVLDTSSVGRKHVVFTATDNVGNTRTHTVPYNVVENEFTLVKTPALTGSGKVGTTLTVTPGEYTPAPTTRSYVWYRDGVEIAVTGTTYLLTAEDLGREIYVEEVIERDTYTTWTFGTNMVDPVLTGDLDAVTAPTVSGTARVGSVLTATEATFEPNPTTVDYRWTRDGAVIPGATGLTYKLVAADAGKRIRVEAVAARAGYETVTATSAPTAAVVAAPQGTDAKGRVKPTLTTKVKALKKRKARVTLTVSVPKGVTAGGTVTVKRGKKTLASGVAVKAGKAKVTVKKLPKGKKVRLTVLYSGTTEVAAAKARTKRFTVR